jgi:ribonuclease Z
MLQVTFMGTGAAFSTRRRTNVSLLVQEGDTGVVIECGPTILYQLDRAGSAVDQVRYLFVSHRHGDHILGLPMFVLLHVLGDAPGPLTIVGSGDVIQTAQALTRQVYPEVTGRLDGLSWVEMPADRPASVELAPSIKLSTLPTPHSPEVSTLASRFDFECSGRSLVYTGDTAYSEKLAPFAEGCDLLVHEANYCEALESSADPDNYGGHSTVRQAAQTASRAGCRILALVHLSPRYDGHEDRVRAEAAQEFDGQILVPSDGAIIYL